MARDFDITKVNGRMIEFVEHYPLPDVEQAFFLKLNLKDILCCRHLMSRSFRSLGARR
jgi:hypothetical protein